MSDLSIKSLNMPMTAPQVVSNNTKKTIAKENKSLSTSNKRYNGSFWYKNYNAICTHSRIANAKSYGSS